MNHRESITIGGQVTSLALEELSVADKVTFAPATHSGSCIAVSGIQRGVRFFYGGDEFEVLKAWDDAAQKMAEFPVERTGRSIRGRVELSSQQKQEKRYYETKVGKFVDLLVLKHA